MKKRIKEKKERKKIKWGKIILITLAVLILSVLVLPLLIPVGSATGLMEPEDMVNTNSNITTIPFEGTDGIDLYSIEQSAKIDTNTNFILLHGSMYNSDTWNLVIDDLSELGNVYAYDQIPYGYSEKLQEGDWSKDNPYTIDAAVKHLKSYMAINNLEKAILVGSSYGGVIAAEFAYEFPDMVDKMILVDPAIMVTETMPSWLMTSPQFERLGPVLARGLASGDGFYESTYFDKSKLDKERLDLCKGETKINGWDSALWEYLQAWATVASDVNKKLEIINVETLVISGSEDAVVPLEQSIEIAELLPNADIQIIDNCGHLPHEESPEEFMEIVNQWMSDF